jgi:hypothetical protein
MNRRNQCSICSLDVTRNSRYGTCLGNFPSIDSANFEGYELGIGLGTIMSFCIYHVRNLEGTMCLGV